MFYIALDKANWSQPKMEKSYRYKSVNIILYIGFLLTFLFLSLGQYQASW